MPLSVHKVHVAIQYEIQSSKNYPLIHNYYNFNNTNFNIAKISTATVVAIHSNIKDFSFVELLITNQRRGDLHIINGYCHHAKAI